MITLLVFALGSLATVAGYWLGRIREANQWLRDAAKADHPAGKALQHRADKNFNIPSPN